MQEMLRETTMDRTEPAPRTILFLSANPNGTDHLQLEKEAKGIQAGLAQATYRDNFRFEQIWAATPEDMLLGILKIKPQIVHFSGHGNGEEGLVMENEEGQPCLLSAQKLSSIFVNFTDFVKCVVLNACFSEVQANAIAQQIPYTIGMNRAISDQAAIKFAEGFYKALGEGEDFNGAFRLGCTLLTVSDTPEQSTPVLLDGLGCLDDHSRLHPSPQPLASSRKATVVSPVTSPQPDPPQENPFRDYFYNEGTEDLKSPFYVKPALADRACDMISQPGALLRIKSPLGMGKSSLAIRVLACAKSQGHRTLNLDLQQTDSSTFADLTRFSQWFCASVGKSLGVATKVGEFWDDIFGPNDNCTGYFQSHVLSGSPLTLMLDNFDRIFDYPDIEVDFCGLLRGWHEKAKSDPQWGRLRLIIVYSQESFVPKDINQSPFNVGVPIELGPWTLEQVVDLAGRYGLSLSPEQQDWVMALTGGHPELVRLTLCPLALGDMTLEQIRATAATEAGIYQNHLFRCLNYLEAHPSLKTEMYKVVTSDGPVCLKSQDAYRLYAMGLIRRQKNDVIPLCEVYRDYFRERLA
jgi:hypothetical protein